MTSPETASSALSARGRTTRRKMKENFLIIEVVFEVGEGRGDRLPFSLCDGRLFADDSLLNKLEDLLLV